MTATSIEWADEVWNPVTGCTRVSPGCARCYIERTPPFRMSGRTFARVGNVETTGIVLHPERLEQPLHWRKPRRVFVNSLSDLFHEEVPDAYVQRVWEAMIAADPQHQFLVLTKRPERARDWLRRYHAVDEPDVLDDGPLENVWLGTSVENARYTWRAEAIKDAPAAVRFVSAEPLLGSLLEHPRASLTVPAVGGHLQLAGADLQRAMRETPDQRAPLDLEGIDWLIVGGESGPGARPMQLAWARELLELGRDAGAAVFVKQLGEALARELRCADRKGGDPDEWPEDLRVRDWPEVAALA